MPPGRHSSSSHRSSHSVSHHSSSSHRSSHSVSRRSSSSHLGFGRSHFGSGGGRLFSSMFAGSKVTPNDMRTNASVNEWILLPQEYDTDRLWHIEE